MTYCVTHYLIKKKYVELALKDDVLSIPLDVFYKYHIHNGFCFDDTLKQRILNDANYYWCLEDSYKHLKIPKTTFELKQKLQAYEPNIVKQVIQTLITKRYLDDVAYMKRYHELRPSLGPKKLSYTFKQKGIDHELIDPFIRSIDENKGLELALEKALKKTSTKSYQKQKEWLYLNLVSKGFSNSLVTSILEKNIHKEESDEQKHMVSLFHKTAHKLKGNSYEKCQMWIKKATSKGFSYHDAKKLCEEIMNENLD